MSAPNLSRYDDAVAAMPFPFYNTAELVKVICDKDHEYWSAGEATEGGTEGFIPTDACPYCNGEADEYRRDCEEDR